MPAELADHHVPPKAYGDFIIERDPEFPNAVQLIGIESLGLTSAPAIAEHVGELVKQILA